MSDPLRLRAKMSSVERAGPWEVPREVEVRAWWGNVELDLREATLAAGTTTIDVRVTMGNVELTVPPHVEVRLEVDTFAASVEDYGGAGAAARGPLSANASAAASAGAGLASGSAAASGLGAPASDATAASGSGASTTASARAASAEMSTAASGIGVTGGAAIGAEVIGDHPYRQAVVTSGTVLKITGRVRFGNLEVHRLWPGESKRDAHRREREHRRLMHGHGRHGHGLHGHGPHGMPDLHGHGRIEAQPSPYFDEQLVRDQVDEAVERSRVRYEDRLERRRERHEERRRRWRELHAERDMWRRSRESGQPWMPWWLMSRMRRRIFIWLALALGGGFAIGWRLTELPPWWYGLIGLAVVSMVSGMIAFRLTRPLILAIKAARDIGDGKLDTRIDVRRHRGETRVLATAINDMAEKIEQQMADQRQLLAAVSHELRTPLGHMRVLVETARVEIAPTGAGPKPDTKSLDEIEREILVLDDLVGKLLASSRLEFGNLERRPLDLGELVTDIATAAGVDPEAIEAIGDTKAAIDPTLIRRALANLLDNARAHGKGAVAVRIERRAGQVAIEVDDAGPGVSAERRADAFRAFGPSSGTAGGGSGLGLGLALVSRIAVAHGGGAWITDRPGGGARVGFAVQA